MKTILLNTLNSSLIPLTKDKLADILGISEREVRSLIEELRHEKYPIVNFTKGYILAKDIEDLQKGINFYKAPIETQLKTLEIMQSVLSDWKKNEQIKLF